MDAEVFGFVLNFQRARFQDALEKERREHCTEFLGPLIDESFRQLPGAGFAVAQMTGQMLAEA